MNNLARQSSIHAGTNALHTYTRSAVHLVVFNLINSPVYKAPEYLGTVVGIEKDVVASPAVTQFQSIFLQCTELFYILGQIELLNVCAGWSLHKLEQAKLET